VFYRVPVSSACLYVPEISIDAYRLADIWKDFNCIEAIDGALNVTFDSQGGSDVSSQYVLQGGDVGKPADPTKSGYVFGGWYKEAACNNSWNFGTDIVISDTTLYAKWMRTVRFDSQGYYAVDSQLVVEGNKVTAPDAPTRTAYIFDGWYNWGDNNPWDFETDVVTSNTTLYAEWIPIRTVTFNSQGGSVVNSQSVGEGYKVTLPDTPVRTGYFFVGWYKDAVYTVTWNFNTDIVTSDTTLYAKWTPIRTVRFNSQGGSAVSSQSIVEGNKIPVTTDPTRPSYHFDGWYKDVTFTDLWDFEADVVMSDTTLYAKWTRIYTITFDSQGGSDVDSQLVVQGKKVILPADPILLDSLFGGWFRDAACTVPYNFADTVASNMTLYAKYISQEYVPVTDVPEENAPMLYEPAPESVIPVVMPKKEVMVVAPVSQLTGEFTAGPNPVLKQSGAINFYRQGKQIVSCELRIYDAYGNIVNRVKINDMAIDNQLRRKIGTWDLCDRNGRIVSEGMYLVKGAVKTVDGKREKVSLIISIR
jgi:uncharacterized repeat protein (TIGR02543 family)